MLKKLFIFTFAFFMALGIYAQDLSSKISKDAFAIVSINLDSYGKKVDFAKIRQSAWYKSFNKQAEQVTGEDHDLLSKIYDNPNEAGINLNPSSYMVAEIVADSLYSLSYLFNISDAAKLEQVIIKTLSKAGKTQTVTTKGKNKYAMIDDASAIIWNGSIASLVSINGSESSTTIDYSDSLYEEKMMKQQEAFRKIKNKELLNQLGKVLDVAVERSIVTNENFKAFNAKPYDIGTWLNMEKMGKVYGKQMSSFSSQLGGMDAIFNTIFGGAYVHLLLNFNKGDLTLDMDQYMAESTAKYFEGAYSKRLNPEAFKFVKGNKILGFSSIALDLEILSNAIINYYKPLLKDADQGKTILAVTDLLGIAIDEQALLTLFKDGAMVAITGTKEFENTYTDYEYDADFNATEVTKTRKEQMPVGAVILTAGNKENVEKIINALKAFKIAKPKGKGYTLKFPETSMEFTMAMNGNLVIITNDTDLNLEQGVTQDQQLPANLKSMIAENSTVFYFDFPNIIDVVSNSMKEASEKDKKNYATLKAALESMRLVGIKQDKNVFKQQYAFTVKDKQQNVLNALSDLFDSFSGQK